MITHIIGGSQRASTIQKERDNLTGWRCYSIAYDIPHFTPDYDFVSLRVLLDSGAFSRDPEQRISHEEVLDKQLEWEAKFNKKHELQDFKATVLASNDLLIDETWVDGQKHKRRWSEEDAEFAVDWTVEAAHYLASQREKLSPRILCFGVQGVTAAQYQSCLKRILPITASGDWIGLGGWCILGRMERYLPVFYQVLLNCIPLIASSPVRHVHVFGCFLEEAIAPLAWMCDRYGLTLSADSNRSWKDLTWPDPIASGVRRPYWRDNVQWWTDFLANIDQSEFYRIPPLYGKFEKGKKKKPGHLSLFEFNRFAS